MKKTDYDLAIIGAGASGMAAAIAAKRTAPDLRVVLLEKKEKPGSKLYATGNGRCNLSNIHCTGVNRRLDFFQSIGIETTTMKDGWLYPASRRAADVVTALKRQLDALEVTVLTDWAVDHVDHRREESQEVFFLDRNEEEKKGQGEDDGITSRTLIIATGGKAGPQYGCTGDGYAWARDLGHTLRRVYPTLTGVAIDGIEKLKGVRASGKASLLRKGEAIAEETGEIQFNGEGISGICVMNLSRFLSLKDGLDFSDYTLRISLRDRDIAGQLAERCRIPGLATEDLLLSMVEPKLADYILTRAGIHATDDPEPAPSETLEKISALMQALDFPVKRALGWKQAQCTGGGVVLEEVDPKTMGSRLVSGLYFAGEILDYDGPCGGYNLDHAWRTGLLAGTAAATE